MSHSHDLKRKKQVQIKHSLLKKAIVVSGVVVLCFIVANLVVYLIFLNRTYPNTRIANYNIGTTNYSSVSKKINSFSLLPSTISLIGRNDNFYVPPYQLGITINNSKITSVARTKAWLPIQNFVTAHKLPVFLDFNNATLTTKLLQLSLADRQTPTNAQITLQNNLFQLIDSKNGYQLNVARAATIVSSMVSKGKTTVILPFTITSPAITDASLETKLQELRAQQGISLNYSYNGKISKPSAATIAGWYSLVNGNYVIQSNRIQAYVVGVGNADGIHVQNIVSAITATEASIGKVSPLTFTLVAVPTTICSPNLINQLIIVSISQQHMWACSSYNLLYDSPVITGISSLPADATPTGTFKVYTKETDLYLNGTDSTGSWHDYVYYWMPFFTDQYGIYGFHDATWRATSDFGNISPSSTNGSHGCVELPLSTAQWLYGWVSIGSTVTIDS